MGLPTDSTLIRPQKRDLDLLRGLYESRIMTLAHIAAIHFAGHHPAAKKRLWRLKAAGLIQVHPRLGDRPTVWTLTKPGYSLIESQGYLTEYPRATWERTRKRLNVSPLTLMHELQVLDVKAALFAAVTLSDSLSVKEFCTWPASIQFRSRSSTCGEQVLIKPDGYALVEELSRAWPQRHRFFLELDRSTEAVNSLVERVRCYANYYRDGGFAERVGCSRAEYKTLPFRVLIVLNDERRRDHIATALLTGHPPVLTQAWLTTFRSVTNDPLGAIWVSPIDYRQNTTKEYRAPASVQRMSIYPHIRGGQMVIERRRLFGAAEVDGVDLSKAA